MPTTTRLSPPTNNHATTLAPTATTASPEANNAKKQTLNGRKTTENDEKVNMNPASNEIVNHGDGC